MLESAVKELSAQQEQFYMVQQKSGTLRLSIREITYLKVTDEMYELCRKWRTDILL